MHDTTHYEIRYSTVTKMFEVLYLGERIDWMLPSYADGEHSIELHASVKLANDEAWAWAFANAPCAEVSAPDTCMQRAASVVFHRYPHAVFGRWNDYVTAFVTDGPIDKERMKYALYAVITLPDGYAVHEILPSGLLGAHIETIRWHDAVANVSDFALAA